MITSPDEAENRIVTAHSAYEQARDLAPQVRARWLEEGRLRSEFRRSVFQLRLFMAEITQGEHLEATIDHADPSWEMGPRPDTRRLSVPLGVVGVFGASNFPFAFSVMGGDSASALAAGCAVVHKIHGGHLHLAVRTGVVVVIAYRPGTDLAALARLLEGQLTATVHADPDEDVTELVTELRERAGRLVWNAWPTGVTVTYAQHHGGPYPATTATTTFVGTAAIGRFMRPVAYDSFPTPLLPEPLRDDNPWGIRRRVNGFYEAATAGGNPK